MIKGRTKPGADDTSFEESSENRHTARNSGTGTGSIESADVLINDVGVGLRLAHGFTARATDMDTSDRELVSTWDVWCGSHGALRTKWMV